jgi:thioredoxin 1
MDINSMQIWIVSIFLAILLCQCSVMAASDTQQNISMIFELNDSTVNSTLDLYPFFILDCYKPGCDPCERMNATLSELSIELKDQMAFGRINAKKNIRTAEIYNITSYPTLLLFDNGTMLQRTVGFGSKSGIVSSLRTLKPDLNTSLVTPEKASTSKASASIEKNCTDIKKREQSMMVAFVVSYCPYGLQMQRVLSGILDQIPDLSENIRVNYIIKMADGNVTSMHGQKESDENLRQICLREEQPDKYWKYISCFLESGNASQCLRTAEVDEVKLDGCLADEKRGLRYAMDDLNLTQQLGIKASPTLILNGEKVKDSDFGGRNEEAIKNLLCCGFRSEPDYCETNLGTEKAITGFTSKQKPGRNTSLVECKEPSTAKSPSQILKNCTDIKKREQSMIVAFVVSYCPYGLQMQRVLSGIVDQIPDLSENIMVRYMVKMADGNLTSMHGQQESDENLRQICIREEQPEEYWPYISCFPESGNSSVCLKAADVDEVKLDGCLADENRSLRYAMIDLNMTEQLGITGSPTLLLNGEKVKDSDFGGRNEESIKNLICCGFRSKPDYCETNLGTEKAITGFTSKKKEQQPAEQASATKLKTIPLAKVGANNPSKPVLVTDRTMAQAVQKYQAFVLMGFADWCGYCQMMNATIQELSRELQGQVTFGLMNAEENNETAERYDLVSYPRLLVFSNGTLLSTQTGYKSSSEFKAILKGLIPGLDTSRSNLTIALPPGTVQRPDIIKEVINDINATALNDTTLRYLETILEAAGINRTTGNTINIFIVNINN